MNLLRKIKIDSICTSLNDYDKEVINFIDDLFTDLVLFRHINPLRGSGEYYYFKNDIPLVEIYENMAFTTVEFLKIMSEKNYNVPELNIYLKYVFNKKNGNNIKTFITIDTPTNINLIYDYIKYRNSKISFFDKIKKAYK